jgi:hypothetical protein
MEKTVSAGPRSRRRGRADLSHGLPQFKFLRGIETAVEGLQLLGDGLAAFQQRVERHWLARWFGWLGFNPLEEFLDGGRHLVAVSRMQGNHRAIEVHALRRDVRGDGLVLLDRDVRQLPDGEKRRAVFSPVAQFPLYAAARRVQMPGAAFVPITVQILVELGVADVADDLDLSGGTTHRYQAERFAPAQPLTHLETIGSTAPGC